MNKRYVTSVVIGRHKQQQWDKQYSTTRRAKTSRKPVCFKAMTNLRYPFIAGEGVYWNFMLEKLENDNET